MEIEIKGKIYYSVKSTGCKGCDLKNICVTVPIDCYYKIYKLKKEKEMKKNFKKSELRTGLKLVTKSQGTWIIIPIPECTKQTIGTKEQFIMVSNNTWMNIDNYDDNMKQEKKDNGYEIISIYCPDFFSEIHSLNVKYDHTLLWEYKEDTIEIIVKINGKETNPVDISEETWLNIRKNN